MAIDLERTRAKGLCRICVDMGTTNTRAWLVAGTRILARAAVEAGVRDTAREGSPQRIRQALRDLVNEVQRKALAAGSRFDPQDIAAAGMITSALGLAEVPHADAPAGARELGKGVRRFLFGDISDLPIRLVPGVRCGGSGVELGTIGLCDVMRGEETLCLGLVRMGFAAAPCVVLNLGSHWKAIELDSEGRISASFTSLSGELIHATQTQTVLASAVPGTRPSEIDWEWCQLGMTEERKSGLARALFCVRLLELNGQGRPDQRLSYLIGAFVAMDLENLLRRQLLQPGRSVLLAGGGAIADAWHRALNDRAISGIKVSQTDLETSYLAGLRMVIDHAGC